MKLIILIILIIIFVFYIKSLPKLEAFSTDDVKKHIVIHIINYDNVTNYIDYDYFNNHILRFINSYNDSDNNIKYILKEIINVDYKNNLYNAYQHVSNKTYPAPNNPSNKIKEFVENDIDFLKKNAVPEESKESKESEESVVPEDPIKWILLNMLDKRNLDGNHINIIVLPKPSNITIGNCVVTSLYDVNDNKTYPSYPSDLPSDFEAIYRANSERITKMSGKKPDKTDERSGTQSDISTKQVEYKEIKDALNEIYDSPEYIEANAKYEANWNKIKELQNIDYNSLTELNQFPDYINRDQIIYETTCDEEGKDCIESKKYITTREKRIEIKKNAKTENNNKIKELETENEKLIKDLHFDEIKNYKKNLTILDTGIGELYSELENQKPDCNAIKQIQNISKIQNNWKLFINNSDHLSSLKDELDKDKEVFVYRDITKDCSPNNTTCEESKHYTYKPGPLPTTTPNKTDILIPDLESSIPTLGALYSSNTAGEKSCKTGLNNLTNKKGLAYIKSSDYYLNTFKDSYI
jgi:hypothetical protein